MPDGSELLKTSLSAAVPLWILQFQDRPWQEVMAIAKESSQEIAEHGDIIMFKGPKRGQTAQAFNALAKGIAALAFVPGGVKFLGMHFEAKHRGEAVAVAGGRPVNLTFEAGTLGRFAQRHGLSVRSQEVAENPALRSDPWGAKARHYVVTIEHPSGRTLFTNFSKGEGLAGPPTVEEVLGAKALDSLEYEVFVGPEEPPEIVALGVDAAGLRAFLGDEVYRELLALAEEGQI